MKVLLMHRDRDLDFDPERKVALSQQEQTLVQDLELDTLFSAMARGDRFLFQVARNVVLSGLDDTETIRYRQEILRDCLANPDVVRQIYSIPIESIESQKKHWMGIFSRYPAGILSSAIEMLELFVRLLRKLKAIADEHARRFHSEGFRRFFAMIQQELDDDYFALVDNHLHRLRFRNGVLLSVELGRGNEGTDHVLLKPNDPDQNWLKRIVQRSPEYSFSLHPRDDHGARALGELRDRVINLVANAVAQSADHIDSFFDVLRLELAFYVGCLNLAGQLAELDEPIAFPVPVASSTRKHACTGLYDVCLALTMKQKLVGNDVDADSKDLVIITGANQGGKSTFLRGIGLAQLMMQCGMFVPAESFSANLCDGLYTHFKREEDAAMESGKLDEELGRMSVVVDHLTSNSMVLFNESFAATNEREGSEIARQVTRALLEKGVKVFFVTHLYDLAQGYYDQHMAGAIFLRAERQPDGTRTFKLVEGEPLPTSHGQDLYTAIFGTGNGDRLTTS